MAHVPLGRERICEGLDSFVCESEFRHTNASHEPVSGFSNPTHSSNLNTLEIRACHHEVWAPGLKRSSKPPNSGNPHPLKAD